MQIITLSGFHGVGKSTYAEEEIAKLEGIKTAHTAFSNTPKLSVAKHFGIDVAEFHTDAKDTKFFKRSYATPDECAILFKEGEDEISYRQLLIRWTDHKRKTDNLIYLKKFDAEMKELEDDGVQIVFVDDLRLSHEFDYAIKHNAEMRALYREGIVRPKHLDSFDAQMVELLVHHADKFNFIDTTRR